MGSDGLTWWLVHLTCMPTYTITLAKPTAPRMVLCSYSGLHFVGRREMPSV